MAKVGRNQSCPCGSGKKYKRCHGTNLPESPPPFQSYQRLQASELIRTHQQGHGRPIIAAKVADHQVVAVGSKIYYSKNWKTFPDFLGSYIFSKLYKYWMTNKL